jgi:hypothetical protein
MDILFTVLGFGAGAGVIYLIIIKIRESRRIYNFHDEMNAE